MFNNKLKNIDINKIQANENQPRTVFNEEKIEELAASIKGFNTTYSCKKSKWNLPNYCR
mgnify:CR=1 FL=1